MGKIQYNRFLLVKDNFYLNPSNVLDVALNTEYYEPEHVTGFRSKLVYHEKGVKQKLEKY